MSNEEYTVTGYLSPDCKSLEIDHSDSLARIFRVLKGIQLEISFKKFYRKRSLAQNRWMWGVCVPTVQQWLYETKGENHDKEAIYTFLRVRVVGDEPRIEEFMGEEVIYLTGKRFSQMNTVEFSDAVEKIVNYFANRGLEIPLPKPKTNNLITDYVDED